MKTRESINFSEHWVEPYATYLEEFETTIKSYVPQENFHNFLELRDGLFILEHKNFHEDFFHYSETAHYFKTDNLIVTKSKTKNNLFHQWIRMLSVHEHGCGFEYDYTGYGVTAGYVSHLLESFFQIEDQFHREKQIVEKIIHYIGEDTVKKLYFEGNMNGLVVKMSEKFDDEMVYDILHGLDSLFACHGIKNAQRKFDLIEETSEMLEKIFQDQKTYKLKK